MKANALPYKHVCVYYIMFEVQITHFPELDGGCKLLCNLMNYECCADIGF